jgi:hypothetical protein
MGIKGGIILLTILAGMVMSSFCLAATNDSYQACINNNSVYPAPIFYISESQAQIACDAIIGSTSSFQNTSTTTWIDGDLLIHRYRFTGNPVNNYEIYQYVCSDNTAIFDNTVIACTAGSGLSPTDIGIIIGYLLASFAFGYTSGYIFLVFKRLADFL